MTGPLRSRPAAPRCMEFFFFSLTATAIGVTCILACDSLPEAPARGQSEPGVLKSVRGKLRHGMVNCWCSCRLSS